MGPVGPVNLKRHSRTPGVREGALRARTPSSHARTTSEAPLPIRQAVSVRRIETTASITGWLHDLPLAGLALTVLALTFVAAAVVYFSVMALAVGRWGEAFKALSPGMLPPMGLLFGLIVGFLAAPVWSDAGRAQDAVHRDAGA